MIVNKSDISVNEGGGGKDKKVFVKGELENKLVPMVDMEGMDTLLMVALIVGMTFCGVAGPFGS